MIWEGFAAALERCHAEFRESGFTINAVQYPRTETGFRLLCAWNNVPPEKAPRTWRFAPNKAALAAWERVAVVITDPKREAERVAYHKGYEEATEDAGGFIDPQSTEEGWQQYAEGTAE